MRALTVKYERVTNVGASQRIKIGVEFAVQEQGTPEAVLLAAREFVKRGLDRERSLIHRENSEAREQRQRAATVPGATA